VPLQSGVSVGPYIVVSQLGAGGMGEVYRAHDGRLKRDVALKILPASVAADPDRRARFEREAQVLASLNHPHIAQIFGVEMLGDSPVLVMELVEGSTLEERLAKGAIPFDDARLIAAQICDGLEAAHDRGVVHRDLKPANIKLLPSGEVKILDFGLARVLTESAHTSNASTVLAQTDAGTVMGTAAYMSPEQARGQMVDRRTDIWAFGCVAYEMLTGVRLFDGASTTDILADVVRKDPDWSLIPKTVPPRVVDVLARCLQKNPKDRWRDIADVRIELDHAAAANRKDVWLPPLGGRDKKQRPALAAAWFAGGAALAAAALLLLGLPGRADDPDPLPVRTTINLPADTVLALGRGSAVALSPDGQTLVFTATSKGRTELYARPLNSFEARVLPGTEGATNPFFSMDGRWVAFFSGGKLKKVSLDGGAPVMIADALNPRGEVWGADDTIYVTPSNNTGISRLGATGGKLEPVTTLREGELSHRWPALLPDGRSMLFAVWNDNGWEPSRITARAVDGRTSSIVEAGGGYPRYIRDHGERGYLVYARSEGLLAAPFDERTLALTGQAVPLVDGVITNLSGGAHFDLSPSGVLAYVPGAFRESVRDLTWVTRDGKAEPPRAIPGLTRTWKLSPDGTRVSRNNANRAGEVWVEELATGRSHRVTEAEVGSNFNGLWSGDGKAIFYARGMGNSDIFRRSADGTGPEDALVRSQRPKGPMAASPDGRWLIFYEIDPITSFDMWMLELPAPGAPAPTPRVFVNTKSNEGTPSFSPNSKWLAYQSNDTGRYEIYVRSFPDGEQVLRVTHDGGLSPVWAPSGNELFYRDLAGNMQVVSFTATPTPTFGKPTFLFDARGYESGFGVSPDGKRLLMMPLIASEQSATQVHVVLNLLSELRQKAGGK
jgi:eukaryotic-like serine/threonine-protein kinase